MSLPLCRDLFLRYTQAGQTVLDPFGGIGSSLLGAALPEPRNVILHELEPNFVELARGNWDKIKSRTLPGMPLGDVQILQGDSRHLPLPDADAGVIDGCVSSPPWANSEPRVSATGRMEVGAPYLGYRACADGIAAAVASPPFGAMQADSSGGNVGNMRPNKDGAGFEQGPRENWVYSEDTPGQIGNLSHTPSAILGSPPYADQDMGGGHATAAEKAARLEQEGRHDEAAVLRSYQRNAESNAFNWQGYGRTPGQIGGMDHTPSAIVSSPLDTDAVQGAHLSMQAIPPGGEFGRVSGLPPVRTKHGSQAFGEQPGDTRGVWLMRVPCQVDPVGLGDMGQLAPSTNVTKDSSSLGQAHQGQGLPVWELLYKPVGQAAVLRVLRFRKFDQLQRLLRLNPQEGQEESAHADGIAVRSVKDVQRSATLRGWLGEVERAAERLVQQGGDLRRDLFQADDLTVQIAPVAALPLLEEVLCALDAEIAISIHSASEIGECERVWGINHDVDCILSSPPYGPLASRNRSDEPYSQAMDSLLRERYGSGDTNRHVDGYGRSDGQIGNDDGEDYASACLAVYRECYRVIRPGGVLVLVTGDYIRAGVRIDLASDTIQLAVAAGFTPVERWVHAKAQVSFWRRLHAKRNPEAPTVTTEDILVFVKNYQGWPFVDLAPTTLPPASLVPAFAGAEIPVALELDLVA